MDGPDILEALGRSLDAAARNTGKIRMPTSLPALLVEIGEWSVAEALESIDRPPLGPPAQALVALAPLLSPAEALAAIARVRHAWDGQDDAAGALALARRAASGDPTATLAAVAKLEPAPRALVLARLAADLPAELRASAVDQALAALGAREGDAASIALLALARAAPERRDEFVERALQALWSADESCYPYTLEWLVYAGAAARAQSLALAETMAYPRAQALAAVLPGCVGEERRALWSTWREAVDRALAERASFVGLRLPLPAQRDELNELLTLVRARPGAYERAVALSHVALHHREYLDEALAAVRRLPVVERGLGLLFLLRSDRCHAREALAALSDPAVEAARLHQLCDPWLAPTEEPPVAFSEPTPRAVDLRARAIAGLIGDERRTEALALLAAARRAGYAHFRAGEIAALASGLEGSARAAALAQAAVIAGASEHPLVGLSQVIRRLPPAERPPLARVALATLGDVDDAARRALPPVIAASPAGLAGELVVDALNSGWSLVHEMAAIVTAGLRAGAVAPIADAILGGAWPEYFVHLLLPYADAGLRPRVLDALFGRDDGPIDVDLRHIAVVDDLDADELRRAVACLPPAAVRWSKRGAYRDPLVVALVRPLARRGMLELLRPALASLGRATRLPALASALDLLAADERATVARQLLGDMRRGTIHAGPALVARLAADGHAGALLELPALDVHGLAALLPHLPASLRPRLRERLAAAADDVATIGALGVLADLRDELPTGALARACAHVLTITAASGRAALYAELAGCEADHPDTETGLTRALHALVDPIAAIAEIEASARRS